MQSGIFKFDGAITEYPDVTTIAIHPGAVWTNLSKDSGLPESVFVDTPELAAATVLALTSGKYDWLSGRYVLYVAPSACRLACLHIAVLRRFVDSTQDLGELEKLKEKILEKDALVAKLALV